MARRAELRRAVEVLHHRLAMAIEVGKDLAVGDFARNRLSVLINQHSRYAHDVAARPSGINLLNGVAHRTRDTILVVGAFLRTILGQGSGYKSDRIVAPSQWRENSIPFESFNKATFFR